jgi:hypothetical protein
MPRYFTRRRRVGSFKLNPVKINQALNEGADLYEATRAGVELMLEVVTNATEHDPGQFSIFGSDIGITARYVYEHGWPAQLQTTLGNGQPFIAKTKKVKDGDLQYVRYIQSNGCIQLTVFND